jgi:radical SAM superfamily enzyme YgiQ (UPF0313 family)
MKILFINPANYKTAYFANFVGRVPYLGPYQLARLTPEDVDVEIIDEVAVAFDPNTYAGGADLAAISMNFTGSATRGYEIADALRARGIKVIIGGNHATYTFNQVKRHADSVVTGEVDEIWEGIVRDAQKGVLKPFYAAPRLPNLEEIRFKRRNPILDAPPVNLDYIAEMMGMAGGAADREAFLKAFNENSGNNGIFGKALKGIQGALTAGFMHGSFDGLLRAPLIGALPRRALHAAIQKWLGPLILKNKDLFIKMADKPFGGYPLKKTIQIGRGCQTDCEFCSVTAFNGTRYRHYKIDQIMSDLSELAGDGKGFDRFIVFADDNIVADTKFAKELFTEIKSLKITWWSYATIQLAKDKELLKLAADSGCLSIFYGLETLKQEALKSAHKGFKANEYAEVIKRTHDHGISLFAGAFIFGLQDDTAENIERTADFCIEHGIDLPQFSVLTPMPGTRLWKRLYGDNIRSEADWECYTFQSLTDPNILPDGISPERLIELVTGAWQKVMTETAIKKRLGNASYQAGFMIPGMYLVNYLFKNIFNDTDSWKRGISLPEENPVWQNAQAGDETAAMAQR